MPFNGAGVFNRIFNWQNDSANNIDITDSRMDGEDDGFATGLSTAICRDGQSTITNNIPFSNHKITGLANGTVRTDAATVGQVQDGTTNWVIAGGTADAITATYSPAHTTLTDGLECKFRAGAANATTTPTFSPDGLTAHAITKSGGTALVAGDIAGNLVEIILRYNLANTRWELVNPPPTLPSGMLAPFAGSSAPSGWLLCDGSAVSRTTYAALFTAISTTYGAGNGSTTFNVPDLRGRSIFGVDNMGGSAANRVTNAVSGITGTTLGASGGDQNVQSHTHVATSSVTDPTHSHGFPGGNFVPTISSGTGNNVTGGAASGSTNTTTAVATGITVGTTNATFGSGASANMPPAMMMNYIIRS